VVARKARTYHRIIQIIQWMSSVLLSDLYSLASSSSSSFLAEEARFRSRSRRETFQSSHRSFRDGRREHDEPFAFFDALVHT